MIRKSVYILMSIVIAIGCLIGFFVRNDKCLLNKKYIRNYLTHEAAWSDSHNAKNDYLGCGMLYFSLAYMKHAKVCVCLGSGGGFVPRMMKQAQRELGLTDAKTILIDGNTGPWGLPRWLDPHSFFLSHFSDIEIIIDTTHFAAQKWNPNLKIDYLHIDADHSLDGSLQDFWDYLPFMDSKGIITFHDTCGDLPCAQAIDVIKRQGFEVVNFKEYGAGVAIIYLSNRKIVDQAQ